MLVADVMGPMIANMTGNIEMKNGALFVHIHSVVCLRQVVSALPRWCRNARLCADGGCIYDNIVVRNADNCLLIAHTCPWINL